MAGFFYCSNAELSGVHELVRVLFEFLFTLTGAEIRRLPAFIRFEFTLLVHFHATNRIDHKLLLRSMIRWIEEAFAGMAADGACDQLPIACLISASRSSGCSSPMESRNRSCGVREPGPSLDARCSIRLSTPPSEVARVKTFTFEMIFIAASCPAFTRIDIMPPNADICFFATAWPGSSPSPG